MHQAAEKFVKREGVIVEVDKDEALPGFDANRNESILRAIEILYAFELGHPFQRTVETVVPAVIRTMQVRSVTAGLSHDGSGMVAADIVETAQNSVISANYNNGFTGYAGADKLSGPIQLIGARNELPRLAEYSEALELRNARIDVPRGGNGRSLRQRCPVVVTGEDLVDG